MANARPNPIVLASCTLTLALCSVYSLPAQLYDIGLTGPQCDSIVENALDNPARQDTLRLVRHCAGDFGTVIGQLLERTDLISTDLEAYLDIIMLASKFNELDVLYAALAVAEDEGKPAFGRAASLAVVESLVSPSGVDPFIVRQYLSYSGPSTGCSMVIAADRWLLDGESPVSQGDAEYALSVAESIAASGAAPAVKHAASCIVNTLKPRELTLGSADIPTFTPGTHFSFVKQCGRKFELRNSSDAWVNVRLQWDANEFDGKTWAMPPKPKGESYSSATWTVPGSGNTAIVYYPDNWPLTGGSALMSETPNNTPC